MPEPSDEVRALAARRAEARTARQFDQADSARDRLAEMGWTVVDEPDGWRLEPADEPSPEDVRLRAADVASVLDQEPTCELSVQWVCEGWPDDVDRAVASFREHGAGDAQLVVADVTGRDPAAFGEGVEVLTLEEDTGWAAARNAGLRRARGRIVYVMDPSIEVTGDVVTPLNSALDDPSVGVVGPFGIVTKDLRQFDDQPEPGPCDAVEGYFMALRRETMIAAGLFDEKFKWYRTADIEYSFRIKDLGLSALVVPVPVTKHTHRMWFESDPATRAKWSKRNYYRFLDRWRDRWDLVLDPEPPDG